MSIKGHRPERTCLGCGGRDDQNRLIRLAVSGDGQLIVDRHLGRGGYLHRNRQCWQMFVRRKGHYRAFHVEVSKVTKEKLFNELESRDRE